MPFQQTANHTGRQDKAVLRSKAVSTDVVATHPIHRPSETQALAKPVARRKASCNRLREYIGGDPYDESDTNSVSETVREDQFDCVTVSPPTKSVPPSRSSPISSHNLDEPVQNPIISSDPLPVISIPVSPSDPKPTPPVTASLQNSITELPRPSRSAAGKQPSNPFQPRSRNSAKADNGPPKLALAIANPMDSASASASKSKKSHQPHSAIRAQSFYAVSMPSSAPCVSQRQITGTLPSATASVYYEQAKNSFTVPSLRNGTVNSEPRSSTVPPQMNRSNRNQRVDPGPEMNVRSKQTASIPPVSQRHPPPTNNLPDVPRCTNAISNSLPVNQPSYPSSQGNQTFSHSSAQLLGGRRAAVDSYRRHSGSSSAQLHLARSMAPFPRHVTRDVSIDEAPRDVSIDNPPRDYPLKRPRTLLRASAPIPEERQKNSGLIEDVDNNSLDAPPVPRTSLPTSSLNAATADAISAVAVAPVENNIKQLSNNVNSRRETIVISPKSGSSDQAPNNRVNENKVDIRVDSDVDGPKSVNKANAVPAVVREHVNLDDEDNEKEEDNNTDDDLDSIEISRTKRQKLEMWQNTKMDEEACKSALLTALRDHPNIISLPFLGLHESDLRNLLELEAVVKAVEDNSICDRLIALNNNRLNQLTNHMCQLFAELQVSELKLSSNSLSHIPDCLAVCKNLRMLNLAHNMLEKLPKSITTLEHLEVLNVSNNLLISLPDEMCKLQRLEIFSVAHNRLLRLPADLTDEDSELFALDISGNKPLATLPPCLEKCTKMMYLELSHTTIFSHLSKQEKALKPLSLFKVVCGLGIPEFIFRDTYGDYPNSDEGKKNSQLEANPAKEKEGNDDKEES